MRRHVLSSKQLVRCGLVLLLLTSFTLGAPTAPSEAGQGAWSKLDLTDLRVQAVAVDPDNPNVLFAGTNGSGIFRSRDRGQHWSNVNSGLGNLFVNRIAINPGDHNVVLAATGRGAAVGDPGAGIYRSTDRGATWTLQSNGFADALAFDPSITTTAYAGGAPPVRKSTDGGLTWSPSFVAGSPITNIDVTGIAVEPTNTRIVLAVGNTEGGTGQVFRSTDAGATWTLVVDGFAPLFDIRVGPGFGPGATTYLAGQEGVFVGGSRGDTFTLTTEELGSVAVRRVVVNPQNFLLVFGATADRGVIRSVDGGDNWTVLDGTLGNNDAFSLAADRATPQSLYAGTADGLWTFTFAAQPLLTIAPTSGPPGTVVQFAGTGFTPGGRVTVLLVRGLGLIVAEVTADPGGDASGSFTMPSPQGAGELSFGPVDVFAIDRATGRESPSAVFTLTRPSGPVTTAFFAEGATTPPFDTWFLVQNPGPNPATLTFTFELLGGGIVVRTFSAGPTSRFSLFANQVLPNQAFSTRIDSDQPIFVERAMYVSFEGDIVPQITSPARLWLFAEGATAAPFHTWLLIQNPNAVSATATITYLLEGGGTQSQVVGLPPSSRTSIFVNEVLPNAAFSSRVESDQPIIVERAMYRFPGNAATADAGVPSAARTWFFAEGGTTINPFGTNLATDTWLLLQNPNNATVGATITLFDTAGNTQSFPQTLAPLSRLNVYVNQVANFSSFGIRVDASAPVIAERSMFFGAEPRGATATTGVSSLTTVWNFAEGSTAPPFHEIISVLNPSGQNMGVTMEFFLEGGQVVTRQFTVGSNSKFALDVDTIIPNAANSARVTTSLPSVVERAMYFLKGGNTGGHDTIGMR